MQLGDFFGPAAVSGSTVAGTASSTPLLSANPNRTRVIFSNLGNTRWIVKMGDNASLTDYSIIVPASGNYVHNAPIHTGSFSGLQAVANGVLRITEFTKV